MVKRFRPRRSRKTRRPRKMGVKRAMRVVSRKKRIQRKSNLDTFSCKLKMEYVQYPVQGVTVHNFIGGVVRLCDSTSVINPFACNDYLVYKRLYDDVRINRVTVRVKPMSNVQDSSNVLTTGITNNGDGRVHTIIDRDSAPSQSIEFFKRYSSYQSHSLLKPWKRSYGVTWPKGMWLDTAVGRSNEAMLHQIGMDGGIYFYAENVLEPSGAVFNAPWATLEITWDVVFRGRKGYNVSETEDGVVQLTESAGAPEMTTLQGYRITAGVPNLTTDQPDDPVTEV